MKNWLIVTFFLIVVVIGFLLLSKLIPINQISRCLPNNCFCEKIHASGIAQPVDTFTSLAFVAVGIFMLIVLYLDLKKPTSLKLYSNPRSGYLWFFAVATILLGLGSTIMHASFTSRNEFFDIEGMFLVAVFMLLYAITRLRSWNLILFSMWYIVLTFFLGYMLTLARGFVSYTFAIILITTVVLETSLLYSKHLLNNRNKKLFLSAIFITIIAFGIWILDLTKILCNPSSLLQGHGIWHVLGSISILLFFLYYKSENLIIE
jgi:hypothetical protein